MLTIILKGTNSCNLACSYCSLGNKENTYTANEDILLEIFRYSCNTCLYRNEDSLHFIFHGGEPTLIKPSVYSQAIDTVQAEFPQIKMLFSMQTNAFHITDETIKFILKYDIHMGVSIDGSKIIHDSQRRSLSNRPTFDIVSQNIIKMLHYGIPVSCLMVLTSHAFRENYDYLKFFEKWNIHLKINPLLNYGKVYDHPELSLQPGQYSEYLIGMYKYIIQQDIEVNISPLDKILQAILSDGIIHECSFRAECNNNFLCIDYNGDIFPCGKYADMNQYKIGNIRGKNYNIMDSSIMMHLLSRRTRNKPSKCQICKYQKLCNAGCNAEASIDGNMNEPPLLCQDYQNLFSFFHGEGLILLKNELLKEKQRRG